MFEGIFLIYEKACGLNDDIGFPLALGSSPLVVINVPNKVV